MGKKANAHSPLAYARLTSGQMREDRVRKGYIPVLVGKDEVMERFLLHTKMIKHPYIVALLEMSAQEFGYEQEGMLKIPCEADCFKRIVGGMISKRQMIPKIICKILHFWHKCSCCE